MLKRACLLATWLRLVCLKYVAPHVEAPSVVQRSLHTTRVLTRHKNCRVTWTRQSWIYRFFEANTRGPATPLTPQAALWRPLGKPSKQLVTRKWNQPVAGVGVRYVSSEPMSTRRVEMVEAPNPRPELYDTFEAAVHNAQHAYVEAADAGLAREKALGKRIKKTSAKVRWVEVEEPLASELA